jgi:hypothetical protein
MRGILGCDEELRHSAWSIVGGPYTHHNASAEILVADDGHTRFVLTADLRLDGLAEAITAGMEQALAAIKRTFDPQRG